MAFVDEIRVTAKAGRGGDGVVRWRREKFVPKGGPAGGDGGRGGDVYLKGVADLGALARYRTHPHFQAGDGKPGGSQKRQGARGEDVYIEVPVGSVVLDETRGITYEILEVGQTIKVLHGGEGGLGNAAFASSTNQAPDWATAGKEGEEGAFLITLKLIADVGFVGLPNAGKSTLLNALTNAKSKVGDYPFTTLEPHLGAMWCAHQELPVILADLPGIIEGAEQGKGLGHKFLRHIERTKTLVYVISPIRDSVVNQYNLLKRILKSYHSELPRRPAFLAITHLDQIPKDQHADLQREAQSASGLPEERIFLVSYLIPESVERLRKGLCSFLVALAEDGEAPQKGTGKGDVEDTGGTGGTGGTG
ncbi:MAG: GTPase Obg [Candidatus Parcubacteria bacterium]|nr:MAG: GTPase Obg [Candidatus Parcubacteria bacterium]